MLKPQGKFGIAVLIAASAALSQVGCVGYPYSTEFGVSVGTDYYTPRYYDGYLVYYDDVGAPYYYVGSSVTYVPRSYRGYRDLRSYYRSHRANYHRWYDDRGYRFRNYRPSHEHRRDRDDNRRYSERARPRDSGRGGDPFRSYRDNARDNGSWGGQRGDRRGEFNRDHGSGYRGLAQSDPRPSRRPQERPGRKSDYDRRDRDYSRRSDSQRPPASAPSRRRPAESVEYQGRTRARTPAYEEAPVRFEEGRRGLRAVGGGREADESR